MTADQPFDISGRTALVTGSSRGIGLALARGLARGGCEVVLHGMDPARCKDAATALAEETGAPVHAVPFDITDAAAIRAGVAEVVATLGSVDILVNNAGIQRRHPFVEFPVKEWEETAPFLIAQQVAPGMIS